MAECFKAGIVYELAGQRDRALAELESALKAGYSPEEISKERELRRLRSGPAVSETDRGGGDTAPSTTMKQTEEGGMPNTTRTVRIHRSGNATPVSRTRIMGIP